MIFNSILNFVFISLICSTYALIENIKITIDYSKDLGKLKHFWKSTGLCPPDPHDKAEEYLLSHDMLLNVALIGSLPFQGIEQIRIHWLLDLIKQSDNPEIYNWTFLDKLLSRLDQFHLLPGFELMGNPANQFHDFNNSTDIELWKQMIYNLATRYIKHYGVTNVAKWRFETWNEPDLISYNLFKFNLTSFINYFNATRHGLNLALAENILSNNKKMDLHLILGGPAGLFRSPEKHILCWGLINYCALQHPLPCLDYISFHKKGNASSNDILQQDIQFAQKINNEYPMLKNIPLVNDESDPIKRWSEGLDWRGDVRYGAMVAQTIIEHHKIMIKEKKLLLDLLGNDNGFLSYYPYQFNQRTLLARFQMNDTNPSHVQMFIKPIYTTMALLSYLNYEEIESTLDIPNERVLSLATYDSNDNDFSSSVIITFNENTTTDIKQVLNITFNVTSKFPNGKNIKMVIYVIDNIHTNPLEIWTKNGSPAYPSKKLRQELRENQGPFKLLDWSLYQPITFSLSLPSIALIQICSQPMKIPGKVHRLQILRVNDEEILLVWNDSRINTKCIKTYQIQMKEIDKTHFKNINHKYDIILPSYHMVNFNGSAAFRVRVLDAWNRKGKWSKTLVWNI